MMTGPGGDYVDDDGYFTCAVSVQHKVGPLKDTSQRKIIFAQLWHFWHVVKKQFVDMIWADQGFLLAFKMINDFCHMIWKLIHILDFSNFVLK